MVNGEDHVHHRGLRERRATRSAVMGIAFQGVYALGQFVIMALLVRRLDPQRFGMWLMIYSLTAWATAANVGLVFVMYTTLGRHALTDRQRARAVLTNVAGFVGLLSAAAAVMLLTAGWFMPWPAWLNVSDAQAIREATPVSVVALSIAALSMPMMLGGHALVASQRGYVTQSVAIVMQLLMIGVLTLGYFAGWPLLVLAVVVMSPPFLAGLTQWCLGLGTGILPAPRPSAIDTRLLRSLLGAGVLFMALDMAATALIQGGTLVLGHVMSPEAVVPYGAAYRLIGLLISTVMMICYAYWPAYSEAGERADVAWIGRGLRRSLVKTGVIGVVGGAVILGIGKPFIAWWLGAEAVPTTGTLAAAVVFAWGYGLYAVVSTPLSGMGRLRVQVVSAAVMVGLFIVVGVGLSMAYGATGLFVGQAIAAIAAAGMNGLFLRRVLRQMRTEQAA